MSPPPRRLSFAVGTSLLGASLSLAAGCTNKNLESDDRRVTNPRGPDEIEDHVNVRAPDPEPAPEPEQPNVNVVADPEPEQPEKRIDIHPNPMPVPEKRVNIRAPQGD